MTDPSPDRRLRDLLDSSFGDGPPAPRATDRLVPARRALRRRRVTSGAAVVLAAAVLVTGATLVGGDEDVRAFEPAGPALPTAPTEPTEPTEPTSPPPSPTPGTSEAYASQLCVEIAQGGEAPIASDVEQLADLGLVYDPAAGTLACSQAGDGTAEVEVEPLPGESRLVRFADPDPASGDERLVAPAGVEILAQSGDVVLPDGFAGPDDRTAVARVRADDSPGGRVTYVLARQLPGSPPEYIAEPDRRDRWPTIAAFLDHAAARYGSGEGLR